MDKNIYNMKVEKFQKQIDRGDYETAVRICDGIDWSQVHDARMLTLVSSAYEHVRDYDKAIDILLMAYEESPIGRRYLYKLTELALAAGDIREAEEFYKNYLRQAPKASDRYLLRYKIADAKGESLDKKITILETYQKLEFDEEWSYCLATLYAKARRIEDCIELCDEIILWFAVGPYVEKAMRLKEKYAPLTDSQKDKRVNRSYYEENVRKVAEELEKKPNPEPSSEEESELQTVETPEPDKEQAQNQNQTAKEAPSDVPEWVGEFELSEEQILREKTGEKPRKEEEQGLLAEDETAAESRPDEKQELKTDPVLKAAAAEASTFVPEKKGWFWNKKKKKDPASGPEKKEKEAVSAPALKAQSAEPVKSAVVSQKAIPGVQLTSESEAGGYARPIVVKPETDAAMVDSIKKIPREGDETLECSLGELVASVIEEQSNVETWAATRAAQAREEAAAKRRVLEETKTLARQETEELREPQTAQAPLSDLEEKGMTTISSELQAYLMADEEEKAEEKKSEAEVSETREVESEEPESKESESEEPESEKPESEEPESEEPESEEPKAEESETEEPEPISIFTDEAEAFFEGGLLAENIAQIMGEEEDRLEEDLLELEEEETIEVRTKEAAEEAEEVAEVPIEERTAANLTISEPEQEKEPSENEPKLPEEGSGIAEEVSEPSADESVEQTLTAAELMDAAWEAVVAAKTVGVSEEEENVEEEILPSLFGDRESAVISSKAVESDVLEDVEAVVFVKKEEPGETSADEAEGPVEEESEAAEEAEADEMELADAEETALQTSVSEKKFARKIIYVGTPTPRDGVGLAVEALRNAYEAEGREISRVAKISGRKLNQKGLARSLSNIQGKDLIVVGAGVLEDAILSEMQQIRQKSDPDKYFVLMDQPDAVRQLQERIRNMDSGEPAAVTENEQQEFPNEEDIVEIEIQVEPMRLVEEVGEETESGITVEEPEDVVEPKLAAGESESETEAEFHADEIGELPAEESPEREGEDSVSDRIKGEEENTDFETEIVLPSIQRDRIDGTDKFAVLNAKDFLAYVRRYAREIDCVIDESGLDAVAQLINEMQDEGERLLVSSAEEIVEDAADEAERWTPHCVIQSRYNKEGKLILREKDFR